MKIFEIYDNYNMSVVGNLLYYEGEKDCIVELCEGLDEWTAPLLFTSFVKRNILTIPRDLSFLWVKERVIPSGRQNIKSILATHKLKEYDEFKFLEISCGKCSQDELEVRRINEIPQYILTRQKKNLKVIVLLANYEVLCFFNEGTVKKVKLKDLKDIPDVSKILDNQRLYYSGKVGLDGYYITFNDSIDIPAAVLFQYGITIPLTLEDFKSFVDQNILDTSQTCDMLQCSRQNVNYLVKNDGLTPIKKDSKGNLYLKEDVIKYTW